MAMCYTSGTTGNPKGVMYSHRSTFLHSMMVTSTANIALAESDRMLVIVPMFHANAWGTPYAAWMIGADLVFPQQFLQAAPLSRIIEETRPTLTGAVPTVLTDLLNNGKEADLSSLRLVMCGGSAVPRALIQGYLDVFGVPIVQGWGMTETSPVCAIGHPPKEMGDDDEITWRTRTGRILPASNCASPTTAAPKFRGTASRSARSRSADRGSPPSTTTSTIPTSSTTDGCAPATSRPCRRAAT
jgi:fatty-acyl-CoA synthase